MTSLEGIRAPTRADSDAPSALTSSHCEAPSSTLAEGPRRARRATVVRFAVLMLRSPEARRSHERTAAVTVPPLTFNVLRSCTPRCGPLRSRAAQIAVAETAPTAEAYDTAPVQNGGRCCLRCCCASRGRCRDRPTAAAEPGVLDVVPA
jgi:hypothetical protein